MKRVALFSAVFTLAACKKPDAVPPVVDAAAIAAPTGSTVPVASVSAPPATRTQASKYTFAKQSDWLGRWTLDIPTTFTKHEVHSCTDSGCMTSTAFAGDGLTVDFRENDKNGTTVTDELGTQAGKVIEQKTLPRGFWVAMTAKDRHVFVQQITGFAEPVIMTVAGPSARRTEIEGLIGHLSASLVVPTVRPKTYCKALPWGADRNGPSSDFDGKLVVADGFNGKMENEKPYVLQANPPLCDADGFACWEAQVYGTTKPDLKTLVGKEVHVTGTFHAMETAHHHRPIMIAASTIGVR